MFFVAVAIGTVVTALTTVGLMSLGQGRSGGRNGDVREPAFAGVGAGAPSGARAATGAGTGGHAVTAAGRPGADTAAAPRTDAGVADATGATAADASAGDAGAPGPGTPAGSAAPPAAEALSGHLTGRTVREQLTADSKDAAIRELAGAVSASGRVADEEALVRAVLAREEQGTTGLGEEIAIPHAKTDAVTAPVVGFARSADGIEWGAPDGTKARLVFLIAVPEAAAGDEHLRILALLSRKLMDAGFRDRLLDAPGTEEILRVLAEIE